MPTFIEKVSAFLVREGSSNPREIDVQAWGSDWGGSTEEGFHSEFRVNVSWVDDTGSHYVEYEGEAMGRLWMAVVSD